MNDLRNLCHDAKFQISITNGLFWVPICTIGSSRYTNEEVEKWIKYTPDEKRSLGLNLYESVQLLYLSHFRYENDYKLVPLDGKNWEFYKPAYEAVRDNYGNCAAICAWIKFMCEEAYTHSGFLHYIREDGRGHVINYFLHGGAYYIVDVTAMICAKDTELCLDNGEKSELRKIKGDFPICIMTKDLRFYNNYHTKIERLRGHQVRHFLIDGYDYVPPINVTMNNQGITVNTAYHAKALDECSAIRHVEVTAPEYEPKWS